MMKKVDRKMYGERFRGHENQSLSRRRTKISSVLGVMMLLVSVLEIASVPGAPTVGAATYKTAVGSWSGLTCTGWASFAVPAGATNVKFKLIGGGGAAGDSAGGSGGKGGQGGVVEGSLSGAAGKTLWAKIGCGGTDQNGTVGANGFIKGGYVTTNHGGGGGGASGLCLGGSTNCAGGQMVAIAAGGGGGGAGAQSVWGVSKYAAGNGGDASTGTTSTRNSGSTRKGGNGGDGNWGNYKQGYGGAGGSVNPPPNTVDAPTSTYAYGTGGNGSAYQDEFTGGGGGGGGLLGGAGGGEGHTYNVGHGSNANYGSAGGGGAGMSWARNSSPVSGATFSASGVTNASCGDSATTVTGSKAGHGGAPGGVGCAGYVEIEYTLTSSSTIFSTQPSTGGSNGKVGVAIESPVVRAQNAGSPFGGIGGEQIQLTSTGDLSCDAMTVMTDQEGYAPFSGCSFANDSGTGTFTITATNLTTGAVVTSNPLKIESNNNWTYTPSLSSTCNTNDDVALPTTSRTATAKVWGGGGGSGGKRSGTSAAGGNGSSAELANFNIPLNGSGVPSRSHVNLLSGCGGSGGVNGNGRNTTYNGGNGGAGWGAGGKGGNAKTAGALLSGNRSAATGGGGGGGSVACLRNGAGDCSAGSPIGIVAAGGGGGSGGAATKIAGAGGGHGTPSELTLQNWYGDSSKGVGKSFGGHGGKRGDSAAGGGGGGGTGATGEGDGSRTPGAGGSSNEPGAGGQGYDGGVRNGAAGSGSVGGAGGTGAQDNRASGGGGGGGGYQGGGGGGGDHGGSNSGGAGGGVGSSWANSAYGGSITFNANGGGAGGTAAGGDSNGKAGTAGGKSLSINGLGFVVTNPGAQESEVGSGFKSLTINYLFDDVGGRLGTPDIELSGNYPEGWTVSSSGVVSGPAPGRSGTYSLTVTFSSTTTNSAQIEPKNTVLETAITFTWKFTAASPSHLAFVDRPQNPSPAATGFPVSVEVQDRYGNVVEDATTPVELDLSVNPTGASLEGGAARTPVKGVVSFPDVSIDRSGRGLEMRATSSLPNHAVSDLFDVVVLAINTVTLSHDPSDPGLVNDGLGGSGVKSVSYYTCSGFWSSNPCANPDLIGTVNNTVSEAFEFNWTGATPGDYRVYATIADNVGNTLPLDPSTSPSTPVRVLGDGLWVEYLVVAGGGAGGPRYGSGGGAGGLVTGTMLVTGSVSVTVGAGGQGEVAVPSGNYSSAAASGNDSVFGPVTALGGGGGGAQQSKGLDGGSGGGGGYQVDPLASGSGTPGQGNDGALGVDPEGSHAQGGGGGKGTAGFVGSETQGGFGGLGYVTTITGTRTVFAAGGGGGCKFGKPSQFLPCYGGSGGSGIGGSAGRPGLDPQPGSATTGSGGGGNYENGGKTGGSGASGRVVVRYPGPTRRSNSGTYEYKDGYWIHTFKTTGSFTFTKTN